MCPAATEVTSSDGVASVRCGVLARANDGEAIDGYTERGQVDTVFDGRRDSVTVQRFCCDDGTSDPATGYTSCVIWQAAAESEGGPLRDRDAQHVDAAPHAGVTQAAEALRGGSLGEAGAIREAMASGGLVLGQGD